MDTFYSLNKLLSTLPFSILGYYEHDKELDDFFERLCDSDFISKKNNIELVSYSYAKLENLNEWGTKSLSQKFFFHALNEKYSLLALNIYYSIRNKLFDRKQKDIDESPHLSNNVAIVLSRLFLKDVGFRLKYTEERNWHFSFLEQNQIFSIQVPLCRIIQIPADAAKETKEMDVFRSALGKFLATSVSVLNSKDELQKLLIQKNEKRNSSYEKKDVIDTPIDTQFQEFLKIFKPKDELEALRNEFVEAIHFWHITNPDYLTTTDTKKHLENWAELFFQIVFISLVYNSWIEYFPSVCGLDESKRNREYRNLGGLILGYKLDDNITLTQEERSIFRIVSSRISSIVAGQWMFDNNKELRRERNRRRLKNAFEEFEKLDADILHGKKQVDASFKVAIANYFKKHEKILTKEFEYSYNSLLKNNDNYCSKYCLFQLKDDSTACGECRVNIKNPLFSKKRKKQCCNENNLVSEHFNVPLIKGLMESLIIHKSNDKATIKKEFSQQEFSVTITYKNGDVFNISEFIIKLKDKMHNGSFIGKFFCDYYDTLDCHGIFIMEYFDKKKTVPFFNSRDSIKFVKPDEKIIEVNESYPFPTKTPLTAKKIKITFKNEL